MLLNGLWLAANTPLSRLARAEDELKAVSYEQGDPTAAVEPVVYSSSYVSQLLLGQGQLLAQIPDALPDFAGALIHEAHNFLGMDRWKNEAEITTILNLFGCPFKYGDQYVAFCAAGIGYCAALAFAKMSNIGTDNTSLRKVIPTIDFYNYYPSPAVLDMSLVARGKSRWVDASKRPKPKRGWLVVYDWSGSKAPETVSHAGIVLSAKNGFLETLEFNTGSKEHPEGGAIRIREDRKYDKTIKGFIKTDTTNA
jgi:hypothetical protein